MNKEKSIKNYFQEHKRLEKGVFENTLTGRKVLVTRERALDDNTVFGQYYSKGTGIRSKYYDVVDGADKPEWKLLYKNGECS